MRTLSFAALVVVAVGIGVLAQPRPAAGRCDRACLEGIADTYLKALVAKDPKRAPLAGSVTYTENGVRLLPGEGKWLSVSGEGTFKLHVADVTAGQIVTFVTMRENGTPFLMSNRLRVNDNRQITEVEVILANNENAAKGVESRAPRAAYLRETPPADRVSRNELVRVANMYFTGMQLNDGKGNYPFADDCHRIENGNDSTNAAPRKPGETKPDPKTARSYSAMWTCREQFESGLLHFVSRIRDRRYVAVDEERGLVVANAFFDHEASEKSRNYTLPDGRRITNGGPFRTWTWMISELFKVEKGLLHEIDAFLVEVPYGMHSGWSSFEDGRSDRIQFPLK